MEALVVLLIVILLLIEGRRKAIAADNAGREADPRMQATQQRAAPICSTSGRTSPDRLHAGAALTPTVRSVLAELRQWARAIAHYNAETSMKAAELQSATSKIVANPKHTDANERTRRT